MGLRKIPAKIALAFIWFYQKCISPLLPPMCRFTPTCSQYGKEAIQRFGFIKGSWLTLRRLLRCHPFHKGCHVDPVPAKETDQEN